MAHVMFGGLNPTPNPPAVQLADKLIQLTPDPLQARLLLRLPGSVAVEVAMKMAFSTGTVWVSPKSQHFLTISQRLPRRYLRAMSVCDPVNGMHHLFRNRPRWSNISPSLPKFPI